MTTVGERIAAGALFGNGTRRRALGTPLAAPRGAGDGLPLVIPESPALDRAAFYGVVGAFVEAMDKHTEADLVGVLAHVLAGFGNMVGPRDAVEEVPHAIIGDAQHPPRLFCGIVGDTATGRKGTAWSVSKRLLRAADEEWFTKCVHTDGGLISGEGLAYHLRDPIESQVAIREKHRVVAYERQISDEGVTDKRLFIVETEFAGVLAVMGKEKNTLSPRLRQAWDNGNLGTLSKHSPIRATRAHVGLCVHVTPEELAALFGAVEAVNGFGNRFLWLGVERSKELPFHEGAPESVVAPFAGQMRDALAWARARRQLVIRFDPSVRAAADAMYHELNRQAENHPHRVAKALLARGPAHVMRLAVCYALLDCSPVIAAPHLGAALALWEYAAKHAERIFATATTGDRHLDKLLAAERATGRPLTHTEIHRLFANNLAAERVAALAAAASAYRDAGGGLR
jgi:hypothetical protein